jgi:hypothetical protein
MARFFIFDKKTIRVYGLGDYTLVFKGDLDDKDCVWSSCIVAGAESTLEDLDDLSAAMSALASLIRLFPGVRWDAKAEDDFIFYHIFIHAEDMQELTRLYKTY